MNRVLTIIDKEWAEVFKQRVVLFVMILVPLLFTILPLVMLSATKGTGVEGMDISGAGLPEGAAAICVGMNAAECVQAFMLNQFMLMFMMMPLMIPITIAAYSIVGEKTTHSLEPLLATPISTTELLAGKMLAAVIPAVIVSALAFILFIAGMFVLGISPVVRAYILSPTWLLSILVIGPIMSVIAVIFALFISSRVNEPRQAEQISGVVIMPLLGVMMAQMAGLIVIDLKFVLLAILVLGLLAIGLLYLGTLIFQRETILTRWK